ncbi:4,5-dihydroxyphthalate decarboxylase [Streptomyces sp. NPDC005227]|uniref:4,5-dihydroxyphthalate decarboxylase n=1 Tax=Streptomyces sp. NPDC005227 TaxID=3364707 RepID=UPI0036B0AEE8
MKDIELRIATLPYEHTRALADGTVTVDGARVTHESTPLVSDIFERMVRHEEFDVAELGLTFYLRTLELDDPRFVAIPVFPNRQFRHSAIFVNTASGIEKPADLAGRTIGEFALYGHDAGFWAKGILSDEYGFSPERSRWVVGGFDWPMDPFDFVPQRHPEGVEVTRAPAGKALGPMLAAGEIDALISADVPRCALDGTPRIARLFPEYRSVETAYYRRTGIFPMMHTVVVRRELLDRHPGLARALYRAFDEAKKVTTERYRQARAFNHMTVMAPRFGELYEENRSLFGDDAWPYGVTANRTAIDTFLRYHHEQGLTRRLLTCEEVFAPDLLTT